jgi:hypothetical protein
MKNTLRMVGHGVDLTLDTGDWSGLPSFVSTPRYIELEILNAYRKVIGRTDGSVSLMRHYKTKVIQRERDVFEVRLAIQYSLYETDLDGISRENPYTQRAFRFYLTHDYRQVADVPIPC